MSAGETTIDLVVATIGRTDEPRRFLESAAAQTYRRFRIILVDQNGDDRLQPIVSGFASTIPIVHIDAAPGVSRARNGAHPLLVGDLVAFPDDDCWYPPDTLARVVGSFEQHPDWDALCGMTCDESGRPTQLRWHTSGGPVTRRNIFRRAIGSTLIVRRPVVAAVGDWDDSYGPQLHPDGTIRGGSEDGDYILRVLEHGFTLGYDPTIRVFHAEFRPSFRDRASMRKAYFYGLDHSRLLKQHGFPTSYGWWRSIQLGGGSAYFLVRGEPGRARFYAAMARGRAVGMVRRWRTYSRSW